MPPSIPQPEPEPETVTATELAAARQQHVGDVLVEQVPPLFEMIEGSFNDHRFADRCGPAANMRAFGAPRDTPYAMAHRFLTWLALW